MSYIKLDRKITEWEWFTDANTLQLWVYLLVNAQYQDTSYRGVEIKRGQLLTGRKKLAEKLEMSETQIRSCLKHLLMTNEITIRSTNKYSVITIVKYDIYQGGCDENDQQEIKQEVNPSTIQEPCEDPSECQSSDHIIRNIRSKERKEIKKNINVADRKPFVKPTLEEIKEYCIANGYEDIDAEKFVNYYEKNDWTVKGKGGRKKMSNWKLCLNSWVVNEIRFNKTNDLRNRSREAYIRDVEMREQQKKKKEEGNWFD